MRKRLYPSASAFMWGNSVITEYDSGCLRSILLSAHGARTEIPKVYMQVGAAHEEWYEGQLKADDRVSGFEREVPVQFPVPDYEDVTYSGRIDVVVDYLHLEDAVLAETKGTISKNTRLKVIRKGIVKLNQLAQLVSYMIAKQVSRGKLVVGYYQATDSGELVHCEGREFRVTIDEAGLILIDGIPSGFSVMDQLAHRQAAARVLSTGEIADRPANADQKYGGPCTYCTFKDVCDKYDKGDVSGPEFIAGGLEAARTAVTKEPPPPDKYKAPKAPSGDDGPNRKPRTRKPREPKEVK